MKQVKLLIALLAVIFASTQAFTTHQRFAATYYSYIHGANRAYASAWTHTYSPPFCNSVLGQPCLIRARTGYGTHPLQTDVTYLYVLSGGFTAVYTSGQLAVQVLDQ